MNPHKALGTQPLAAAVGRMAVIRITLNARGRGWDPTGK